MFPPKYSVQYNARKNLSGARSVSGNFLDGSFGLQRYCGWRNRRQGIMPSFFEFCKHLKMQLLYCIAAANLILQSFANTTAFRARLSRNAVRGILLKTARQYLSLARYRCSHDLRIDSQANVGEK
jgi:hypothetical protein